MQSIPQGEQSECLGFRLSKQAPKYKVYRATKKENVRYLKTEQAYPNPGSVKKKKYILITNKNY